MSEVHRPEYDKRYIQFTGEQLQQMSQMYLGGASLEAVSKRYGISPSVVSRRLKARGVNVRPKSAPLLATPDVITRSLALKGDGLTWAEIEKIVGVNWQTITAAIRKRRLLEAKEND